MSDRLRIFRRDASCAVLGPGSRAVLWVQGCTLACPGCLVPESWVTGRPDTQSYTVAELANWLLACPHIEGVTLSGGEPMQQANLLAAVVHLVRQQRDLGVVCYTGYRLETLRSEAQRQLLEVVDLLIDGPYRKAQHADLLWRASSNQRLIPLTARYLACLPHEPGVDRSAGLEWQFRSDGRLTFAGVPPWPDYVAALQAS